MVFRGGFVGVAVGLVAVAVVCGLAAAPCGVSALNAVSIRKHKREAAAAATAAAAAATAAAAAGGEHDHNARATQMMADLDAGDSTALDALERNIDSRLADTKRELGKIVDFRRRAMALLQSKLAELNMGGGGAGAAGGSASTSEDQAEVARVRAAIAAGERLEAHETDEELRLAQQHDADERETDAKAQAYEAALDEAQAEGEAEAEADATGAEAEAEAEAELSATAEEEDTGEVAEDLDLTALANAASEATAAAAPAAAHDAEAAADGAHDAHDEHAAEGSPVDALIALDDEEQSTRAVLTSVTDEFARMRLQQQQHAQHQTVDGAAGAVPLDAAQEQEVDAALDARVTQLRANLTRIATQRLSLFRRERLHPNRLLRIGHGDSGAATGGLSRAAMLQADRDRLKQQLHSATSVYGTDATSAMEEHVALGGGGGAYGWDVDASRAHGARSALLSWIALLDAELADAQA